LEKASKKRGSGLPSPRAAHQSEGAMNSRRFESAGARRLEATQFGE
jgi:hypothetical protein